MSRPFFEAAHDLIITAVDTRRVVRGADSGWPAREKQQALPDCLARLVDQTEIHLTLG